LIRNVNLESLVIGKSAVRQYMCIVKGWFFSISWLYTNLDIFSRYQ